MQLETDQISSYYHKSAKPSFFFYRASVIVSMVALLSVLGINLYFLNETTSTTSKAAAPPIASPTHSASSGLTVTLAPTSVEQQVLPPLPAQCNYETSTDGNIIKCTEGGKSCIYKIVNNRYVMTCDKL